MRVKHIINDRNDLEREKSIRFSNNDRQYMVNILEKAELILDRYHISSYPQIKLLFKEQSIFKDFLKYMYDYFKNIQIDDDFILSFTSHSLNQVNQWEANVIALAMMLHFESKDAFFKGAFSYFNLMQNSKIDGAYVLNELRKIYNNYINQQLIIAPHFNQNHGLTPDENETIDINYNFDSSDGLNTDGENVDDLNTDGENVDGLNTDGEKIDGLNTDGEKIDDLNTDGENVDDGNPDGENSGNLYKFNFCNNDSFPNSDDDYGDELYY